MATSGTGKWAKKASEPATSIDSKDFWTGVVTVDNAAYNDDKTYEFGFNAKEVHIRNSGAADCVFRWIRNRAETYDNGIVPAGETKIFRSVNHAGIQLRHDGSSTTVDVIAV